MLLIIRLVLAGLLVFFAEPRCAGEGKRRLPAVERKAGDKGNGRADVGSEPLG
ncbi:Uncharacterised protein [Leminorella grimontii]|nr:Uncharacterised protein [Leminorella grimontii]